MVTDSYYNKSTAAAEVGVIEATERTALGRHAERGSFDRDAVYAILDEALVAHVGFVTERGPVVLPMTYGRIGDELFLHGAPASRFLRTLKSGVPVCVTVTLLDGLVLARSTFHHSMNYRSVVVFATATEVVDLRERARALAAVVDHVVPGRSLEARAATEKEVRGTLVLRVPIDEASAKIRVGPPVDDEADLALPVWAGVLPLTTSVASPERDGIGVDVPVPSSVVDYHRPGSTAGAMTRSTAGFSAGSPAFGS